MNLGLKGRVAVVTGSSQGIGRAVAILLATEGARVVITYRTEKEKAEAVAASVRSVGADALVVPFDLASDTSIRGAFDSVVDRWGRIDVLINNAVQWATHPAKGDTHFDELPFEDLRAELRANVEGTLAATQAAVASMRKNRWGRIVTVSSDLAVNGMPGSAGYSAAKSALHGLTRSLFTELAPEGILVNVVMAGLTLTDRAKANVPAHVLEHAARSSPLRRLPTPEEIATTIVFLASEANTTVNGEIILSSGGHA
jgi:NAD(P)-dependent dehydrogenase (short-subunit alcohol dehydrogenase family)